jgi:glycosyltransferase involved in cell wall biosynthesis
VERQSGRAPTEGAPVLVVVTACHRAGEVAGLVARVAADHPDLAVVSVFVDVDRSVLVDPEGLGEVRPPAGIGLGREELHRLAARHDEDGLVEAMAAPACRALEGEGLRPVLAVTDPAAALPPLDLSVATSAPTMDVAMPIRMVGAGGDARWPGARGDGDEAGPALPYGWGRSAAGLAMTATVRSAVRRAAEDGAAPPPSPWEGDGSAFTAWLTAPDPELPAVSRFLHELWRCSPEVWPRFGHPGAPAFGRWAGTDAGVLGREPAALLPRLRRDGRPPVPGVNLVGYFRGDFGVGEAGRMLSRAVSCTGLPLSTTTIRPGVQRHASHFLETGLDPVFALNLLAVNPQGLLEVARDPHYAGFFTGRRNVGAWYWEVDVLPDDLTAAFDLVDEVWCSTRYIVDVLSPLTAKPVRQHPLVVTLPDPSPHLTRQDLGLPSGRYLFGFSFDHMSVLDRKNPLGLVRAYTAAFGPDDGVALVLKSINGEQFPDGVAALDEAVAGRADIVQLDAHLAQAEMRALLANLDAFVSLHRSEGLGLGLLDAMALGKPVVATGYSGNMTFMDDETAVLVPFELVEVGPGHEPYPSSAHWAEPDLDAAAAAMRRLAAAPAEGAALGARARRSVGAHTRERAARWFAERYAELVP